MATPAKTSDVPAPAALHQPTPVVAPTGWLVSLMAGVLVVLSTWYIYPHTADGMWAGYRGGMVATVIVLASFILRTRVARPLALGLIGLGGAALVLFAFVYGDTTSIFVTELGGGVLAVLGALLAAVGRR